MPAPLQHLHASYQPLQHGKKPTLQGVKQDIFSDLMLPANSVHKVTITCPMNMRKIFEQNHRVTASLHSLGRKGALVEDAAFLAARLPERPPVAGRCCGGEEFAPTLPGEKAAALRAFP